MEIKPFVSVTMLVYNNEAFLRDSIESVLNQTYKNFELLILSAETTNKESLAIINSFSDPRVVHIRRDAASAYITGARNLGLDRSRGVYIAHMDSDDIALPRRLETEVKFMEKHKDIAIAGSYAKTFGAKNGIIMRNPLRHEEIKANLLFHTSMVNPTVIMRKDAVCLRKIRYDNSLKYSEDLDFWSRAIHEVKFANIPKVLLFYRTHEKQLTHQEKDVQENGRDKIFQKQLDKLGIASDDKKRTAYKAIRTFRAEEATQDFLKTAEEWLKSIVSINLPNGTYEQEALKRVLAKEWLNLCRLSVRKMGANAWKIFWRSEIRHWLKKEPRALGRMTKFYCAALWA